MKVETCSWCGHDEHLGGPCPRKASVASESKPVGGVSARWGGKLIDVACLCVKR